MKEWKRCLVDQIVSECENSRIVRLRDVARAAGYTHIPTGDVCGIIRAASRKIPEDYSVGTEGGKNLSLFQSTVFAQNGIGFWEQEKQ